MESDYTRVTVSASEDSDLYENFSADSLSTTPSERIWSERVPLWSLHESVYPQGRRCFIENSPAGNTLQYVHCLSRRLESSKVNSLEYAWGMKRGTLNLDTRKNVFCLSAKFKDLWKEYKWLLLPEMHILEQYHAAMMNDDEFPDIGDGPYQYRFVPHPDMKSVPIHRQIGFPDGETEQLEPKHFQFCSYPFKDLETLTSHIHPKFVICHVGSMAMKLDNSVLFEYVDAYRDVLNPIVMSLQIYNQWTRVLDKTNPRHLGFLRNKLDPDDVPVDYTRTALARLRPYKSEKRRVKEQKYAYAKDEASALRVAPNIVIEQKLRLLRDQADLPQATEGNESRAILSATL